jgi:hypothetical protein
MGPWTNTDNLGSSGDVDQIWWWLDEVPVDGFLGGERGAVGLAYDAGLCRRRRLLSRCSSSVTASRVARRSRGGKPRLVGDLAAGGAQRAGERHPIGVMPGVAGADVDEVADRVVDQQDPPDLLLDPVRVAGAQHRSGLQLVGLDLVEDGLDLPALR